MISVFFFGDSICFGQGVPPHLVWVTRLSQALAARFEGRAEIIVQNPSVNGNTTRMALDRMAYDVQSHAPHILYVQFGMNDCNGWETDKGHPRTSRDAFASNLSEIIERGRLFGARRVILGTTHPTTRTKLKLPHAEHTYEDANRAYNAIIRQVGAAKVTMLADAEAAFDAAVNGGQAAYGDFLLGDQLHLSKRGHDLYLENNLPILAHAVESVLRNETDARHASN